MSRSEIMADLPRSWDIVVVGGGMTGAGVFREAARAGYRTLLLEQRDFSWGTSSRSGKLVHGGLRYLSQGQIRTTWHSVRERERLLHRYPGLVEELTFAIPVYDRLTGIALQAGLTLYDSMALHWSHRAYGTTEFLRKIPNLNDKNLRGGLAFRDARTDDARLVFRVIREGERYGGTAINYMRVNELLRNNRGIVCGVTVEDALTKQTVEVSTRAVVNATGVWADKLRHQFGEKPKLRKLRGSHLLLPFHRLPLEQAISFNHPSDHRPLYAMPWQGKILVGTTDMDHEFSLSEEPKMSQEEGHYLLTGLNTCFPTLHITARDIRSCFAGVRPVLNTGKSNPSKESRDIVLWSQQGLVTVTGGKLTTFPLLARKALQETVKWLGGPHNARNPQKDITPQETKSQSYPGFPLQGAEAHKKMISSGEKSRWLLATLTQRYGEDAPNLLPLVENSEWQKVPGTEVFWAELVWSALTEQIVHLEDLLLRRTRLGLLLPEGGIEILPELQKRISMVLGWHEPQWEEEKVKYLALWNQAYSPRLLQ